jgi:hypothetical protein
MGKAYCKLLTKCVRKLAGRHAPPALRLSPQIGTAIMARGAAVATMRKAAMIRNQWTGKVARRAFMAADSVLILVSRK